MATIIPGFSYTNGVALDPDGHTRNVYDTSTGRGIMSTANGVIDTANLDTNFKIHSEHIMPQTALRTSNEFSLEAVDCFEEAFGANIAAGAFTFNTAPDRLWVPVPGCGVRFYVTEKSLCLFRVGVFCHPFKVAYRVDSDPDVSVVFDMAIGLKLDQQLIPETKRPLPATARYKTDATVSQTGYIDDVPSKLDYGERNTATWYDFHSVKLVNPGAHSLQLCIYMENVEISREKNTGSGNPLDALNGITGQVKLERARYSHMKDEKVPSGSGLTALRTSQYGLRATRRPHLLFQRATFGVRHARVLAMKRSS